MHRKARCCARHPASFLYHADRAPDWLALAIEQGFLTGLLDMERFNVSLNTNIIITAAGLERYDELRREYVLNAAIQVALQRQQRPADSDDSSQIRNPKDSA